jgi:hypothetical protein
MDTPCISKSSCTRAAKIWLMSRAGGLATGETGRADYLAFMLIFAAAAAAQTSAADKLRQIPVEFWWRIGVGIAVVLGVVILLRKIAKVNKVFLGVGAFLFATIVGFNWIYERNEPTWATPTVQWLAEFFPSKGTVGSHARL